MPSAQINGKTGWRYALLSLGAIIIVGLLTYANTFSCPFVLDDLTNIVDNPYTMVTDITFGQVANILKSRELFRPVANATFALNYRIHGHQVYGYHVVNLLIHLLTAILLFLVARQAAVLCCLESRYFPLLAALLWMTIPVHTQSVTYIVQRMTSLAALFYLLSLYCYIRARLIQRSHPGHEGSAVPWFIACVLAALLGLTAKETTAFLLLFILIYEWYFLQNLDRRWIRRQYKWILALAVISLTVTFIYLEGRPVEKIFSAYDQYPFTMAQRLLTQPQVVIYYISLLACPHPARLNLDYDFPLARSLFDPFTALSLAALTGLAAAAVYTAQRHRLLSFAILWFLGNLAIESSFLGIEIFYEHRTYLPSIFPVIVLTSCLLHRTRAKQAMAALIILMTIIFGTWTFQRNTVWRNSIDLWLDSAKKAPGNDRPFSHLGLAYGRSGKNLPLAIKNLHTALELCQRRWGEKHAMTAIHCYNLGEIYRITQDHDQAVKYYRQALTLLDQASGLSHPGIAAIYNDLAAMQKAGGDIEGAIASYHQALEALPDLSGDSLQTINAAGIYNNLGIAWAARGDYAMADKYLRKTLTILREEFGDRHPYTRRAEKTLQELVANQPDTME